MRGHAGQSLAQVGSVALRDFGVGVGIGREQVNAPGKTIVPFELDAADAGFSDLNAVLGIRRIGRPPVLLTQIKRASEINPFPVGDLYRIPASYCFPRVGLKG
jgi:hypothetical protein